MKKKRTKERQEGRKGGGKEGKGGEKSSPRGLECVNFGAAQRGEAWRAADPTRVDARRALSRAPHRTIHVLRCARKIHGKQRGNRVWGEPRLRGNEPRASRCFFAAISPAKKFTRSTRIADYADRTDRRFLVT